MSDGIKINGNGKCCSCGREAPPDVEKIAEALAIGDDTRLEWLSYDEAEQYRVRARAAKDVIG